MLNRLLLPPPPLPPPHDDDVITPAAAPQPRPLGLLVELDLSQCLGLSNADIAALSHLLQLRTLHVGPLSNVHPDWVPAPLPPPLDPSSAKGLAEGAAATAAVSHLGFPGLRHLRLRDSPEGVPVRRLAWLLGPDARLESLFPFPARLDTGCGDFGGDQALTMESLVQLLGGGLAMVSSRLALVGMLGFSAYNCSYMFHTLKVWEYVWIWEYWLLHTRLLRLLAGLRLFFAHPTSFLSCQTKPPFPPLLAARPGSCDRTDPVPVGARR